jgi:membrane associated rhomboid family serine protease
MYFDLLLLSVIVVTAYLGPAMLRRQPRGRRAFAGLLLVDGVAALLALLAPPGRGADMLGFVAIGAAVCLLLVPPVLRDLARRALRADHPRLALRLVELWDHLQPGMGVGRERDLIEVLLAVRSGRVDDAVAVLREARAAMRDPRAHRHMDERIVATYLTAQRWRDAIETYEARLAGEPPSAQLCVELVWAYCESGDLEAAGRLVDRIATAPGAAEPMWTYLAHRARLMFLAFVGRTAAVEGILAPTGALGMLPDASRQFWLGVARLYAGDRDGARTALARAARLARRDRRAREVAEQFIARIDEPGGAGARVASVVASGEASGEASGDVAAMAERFAAETLAAAPVTLRVTPQLSGVPLHSLPVTVGLLVTNGLVFLAVLALFGSTGDPGALVRAGANVKTWVLGEGQLWRLPSSMFLHVGHWHLLLNMYGLWILGKLVEQMHGSVRTFAIYMAAGLAGAVASAWFGAPGMSAGASGAVLGLLGALIAELALHRHAYPRRWRSALLGPLLFVAAAQVVIGFFYSAIDQWAHVAGLVAGAAGTAVLSRQSAWGKSAPVRVLASLLAVAGLAALGWSAYGIATVHHGEVLARAPRTTYTLGGLSLTGPVGLRLESGSLVDDVSLWLEAAACPAAGKRRAGELCAPGEAPQGQDAGDDAGQDALATQLAHATEEVRGSWPDAGVRVGAAADVPAPWQGQVLHMAHEGMGGVERYQVIVAGRRHGDVVWLVVAQMPEALADEVMPVLVEMLRSAAPAGQSGPAGAGE